MATKTLSEKALEVRENGAFLYAGQNEAGRDLYEYRRTGRDGVEFTEAECDAQRPFLLTVTMGRYCAGCTCPEGVRQRKAGDGVLCKHGTALEFWLSDAVPVAVPVKVEPSELTFVTKPVVSGWDAVCGLGSN